MGTGRPIESRSSEACIVENTANQHKSCLSVWEQLLLSMVTVKTPASGLQSRASSHWAAMLGWRIAETGMHTSLGTSLMFTICQQPDRPGMRTCQQ